MQGRGHHTLCLAGALASLVWAPACTSQLELGEHPEAHGPQAVDAAADAHESVDQTPAKGIDLTIAGCSSVEVRELSLDMERAHAIMVVERSLSMQQSFGALTRLETVAAATLKALANRRLPVGLVQFPGTSGFCERTDMCCASPLVTAPRSDQGRTIAKVLRCEGFGSSCSETSNAAPTAAALAQTRTFLQVLAVPGNRPSVFLVTDGDPHCADVTEQECENAVAQTAALSQSNVPTHMVALGAEAQASTCLRRVAEAGETWNLGEAWHAALSAAELEQSLAAVVAAAEEGFCRGRFVFSLRRPEGLRVFVDGVEIPNAQSEPAAASSYNMELGSSTRFRIRGEACEQLKRRNSDVRMFETCCRTQADCL